LGQFTFSIDNFPEINPIFELIRTTGSITWQEMFTTFNMGIGLVVVVPSSQVDNALSVLSKHDKTYRLGIIEKAKRGIIDIKPYGVKIE
jgi:phosphoribosylformylglycinamidine cyclo-ligase